MPLPVSIDQRMIWAEHHYNLMVGECIRHIGGKSAFFLIERKDTAEENAWGRFHSKKPIPHEIPLMLGDCLQSTHSCLDYLVCQLALIGKESPNTKHTFPVTESLSHFNEAVGRHALKGVPFEAITIIEREQPYNRGGDPHKSALWILKTLTNMHKHRDILLTTLGAAHAPDDLGDLIVRDGVLYTTTELGTLDLDAEFGPFPIVDGEVQMKHMAIDIFFEQEPFRGQQMQSVISRTCQYVRNELLPQFERFF
jgi:hypothetical protein